jgi:hypothetical protein
MSSQNTKNTVTINDNMGKDNNNDINAFSNNFNKCLNKYKYSKNSNDNNTENSKINNNDNNNKTTSNKNNSRNKGSTSSLAEFEFFYNDSQNKNINTKQNSILSRASTAKTNDNNRNKTGNKPSQSYTTSNNNNLTNNNNNTIKNTSPMNKILAIKSQMGTGKSKTKNKFSGKNKKKNLSVKTFDHFLQNVKDYQKKRETYLNNLRSQSLEKETAELKQCPSISKNSLLLAKNIKRYPLYQKQPLNEEKNLDKKFRVFYSRNLFDNIDNAFTGKTQLNNQTVDEKFNNFYNSNLKWKEKIEETNNKKRDNYKNLEDEIYSENYSFKPMLDKHSLNIVDRKIRNNCGDYYVNNDLFDGDNDREMIEKLKTKLKPILSEYYINNSKKPYSNKRSIYLQKCKSDNNMRNNVYHNSNFKINQNPNSNNKNCKINYKLNEKKFTKEKKGKSEEKKGKEKKKGKIEKKGIDKKKKEYYLLIKIQELKKDKDKKKKELYKLNVCQGSAWNEDVVNNILPKKKCGHIIEGLL